jgi:signal transduction histidine kinase
MNSTAATLPNWRSTRRLVLTASAGAVIASLGAIAFIPAALQNITSSKFLPHVSCYLYDKQLVALHLGSDAAIWLAYLAISCTLVYLVWRTRREIPFSWMFLAFGTFIVACGFTHFMEIVVLWHPLYWLAGDVKLVTAVASVVTAIALPSLIPQIHSMIAAAHVSEDRRQQLERANKELQQISSHIMTVQDIERRRIAKELHDGVGEYLAAIKTSCDAALASAKNADESVALQEALGVLERCTTDVRTMSHLLHPPLLEEMGLASAIPWYVEGFTERSGIEVDLRLPGLLPRMPTLVELTVFRILQEALTNIHRHPGSKSASLRVALNDGIIDIAIEDRGKDLDSSNGEPFRNGIGVSGMRERLREQGGELRIQPTVEGTLLHVTLPLVAASDESGRELFSRTITTVCAE